MATQRYIPRMEPHTVVSLKTEIIMAAGIWWRWREVERYWNTKGIFVKVYSMGMVVYSYIKQGMSMKVILDKARRKDMEYLDMLTEMFMKVTILKMNEMINIAKFSSILEPPMKEELKEVIFMARALSAVPMETISKEITSMAKNKGTASSK